MPKKMQLPDEMHQEINDSFSAENKSIFDELYAVNVSEKVEEKNGLSYLSWAYAWAELKKKCPDAQYEIERFGDNKVPYFYDENLGYMVFTSLTVNGQTHEMWLPVMDGANKAMKNKPYSYKTKNPKFRYAKRNKEDGKYYDTYGVMQEEYITKTVDAATMFDINKTIMRCLVKNIGMFGLGLYIYAGEDLPEAEKADQANELPVQQPKPQPSKTELIMAIGEKKTEARNIGINLDEPSIDEFIKSKVNGKSLPAEMTDSEMQTYVAVLNALIKRKREKDEVDSQIQSQAD